MQKLAHEIYSFDEFRLDLTRGALFRGEVEVKLRPKSFDVLRYLARNQGRLVTKDELIRSIWDGMAVTDDSLVQCMTEIRRALGDDAQRMIKTVPRRGYIFDIDVSDNGTGEYTEETSGVHLVIEETVEERGKLIPASPSRRLLTLFALAASLVILTVAVYAAYVYFLGGPRAQFASVTMKPLTTDGKATLAAISPDGKYIAFVIEDKPKERSLWVRQVAAMNPIRIVPPAEGGYGGLTFSPDAGFIYFVRNGTLFQIPTLGGTEPRRILDGVDSEISFSPDGTRFAYVKTGGGMVGGSTVLVANTDGDGEPQVITRRQPPEVFRSGCAWSPDGKRLVCTGGDNQLFGQMYPVIVNIADGAQTPMTSRRWNLVGQKHWMPDGSGFVMDALSNAGTSAQPWFISYPDGEARQVYSNPNDYKHVSMTADSRYLVAIERRTLTNIYALDIAVAPAEPVSLSSGTIGRETVGSTTPDGRIMFVSEADGDRDIWIMNADGNSRQQLTIGPPMDSDANVSPDGRQIVFARAGQGIWKMAIDGAEKQQLAKIGMFPEYAPDAGSVFFTVPRERWSLWKVGINGGDPVRVTDHAAVQPSVSPDGRFIAYMRYLKRDEPQLCVAAADTLEIVRTFEALPRVQFEIEWTPDSSAIAYNATVDGIDQIIRQPLNGDSPEVLVAGRSESDIVGGFTFSPDGRLLYYSAGSIDQNVVMFTLEK